MARSYEDALWVSCPKCDARPGDPCKRDPLIAEVFNFSEFRLHYARVDHLELLNQIRTTTNDLGWPC